MIILLFKYTTFITISTIELFSTLEAKENLRKLRGFF